MIDYLSTVNYITSRKTLCNIINYANKIITAVIFVSYPVFLAVLLCLKNENLLKYILFPAVSFILVSVFRKFYNAPRPYEKYNYKPIGNNNPKSGQSFPSRHIFSAFIISFVFLDYCSVLGAVFLVLSALLGFIRVVSGVHFIKDVLAGMITAVLVYIIMICVI